MVELHPEDVASTGTVTTIPFLARFAARRNAAPSPRGETTQTMAYPPETSDEQTRQP